MSHRHKVDPWLMALTTKKASYIIVLGIVISVLPISSTLLQDGNHVRFEQKPVNKGEEEPIKHRRSPRNEQAQWSYFPMPFPKSFRIPITTPFPWPFPRPFPCISRPFRRPFPMPIPSPFPSPIPIIPIAAHYFKKAGFRGGSVRQLASISAVGT